MSDPMPQVRCIVNCACTLGEAPLWCEATATLYWLDIGTSSALFEWNSRSGKTRRHPVPGICTGLALTTDGELVLVAETGLYVFDPGTRVVRGLRTPPCSMHGMRFNDCGCDRLGRLWTGTMLNDLRPGAAARGRIGELYRIDADLSCHEMIRGIGCPNTFAWSPDDRTFYSADSATECLYAYDFDLASGAIANRREFARPAGLGIPDGSAMDAEGCLWNARWGARCVIRIAPDATVIRTVPIAADLVTSCAFGGPNLETLYVTTARFNLSGDALARQPLAGGVFAFEPGVSGIPVPAFRPHRLSSSG